MSDSPRARRARNSRARRTGARAGCRGRWSTPPAAHSSSRRRPVPARARPRRRKRAPATSAQMHDREGEGVESGVLLPAVLVAHRPVAHEKRQCARAPCRATARAARARRAPPAPRPAAPGRRSHPAARPASGRAAEPLVLVPVAVGGLRGEQIARACCAPRAARRPPAARRRSRTDRAATPGDSPRAPRGCCPTARSGSPPSRRGRSCPGARAAPWSRAAPARRTASGSSAASASSDGMAACQRVQAVELPLPGDRERLASARCAPASRPTRSCCRSRAPAPPGAAARPRARRCPARPCRTPR